MLRLLCMCEYTYNFIQWKNRVRIMTFGFRFCSVFLLFFLFLFFFFFFFFLGGGWFFTDRFGSGFALSLLPASGAVRFLPKSGFWFCSFLLGSVSFPSLIETVQRTKVQDRQQMKCEYHKTELTVYVTDKSIWWKIYANSILLYIISQKVNQ